MKKSLILAGMLAVGYANAQEGNVGINTEFPKATLEVLPSAKNLAGTTNEGIVAPKLSKTRIASIADTNLVEGTLVYATDATYTGNNAKVAKITEKGYYFYNGTEWVKAGTNPEDQLWAQRNNNGVTETYLKPADANKDQYLYSEKSTIFNLGNITSEDTKDGTGNPFLYIGDNPHLLAIKSAKLPSNPSINYNFFSRNFFKVDNEHAATASNKRYIGKENWIKVDNLSSNIDYIIANDNKATFYSSSNVGGVSGGRFFTEVGMDGKTPTVSTLAGIQAYPTVYSGATVRDMYGIYTSPLVYGGNMTQLKGIQTNVESSRLLSGYTTEYPTMNYTNIQGYRATMVIRPNTNVQRVHGSYLNIDINDKSNTNNIHGLYSQAILRTGSNITEYNGIQNHIVGEANANVKNVFGFRLTTNFNQDFAPTNMYGLYLASINKGTENNYAIYTNAGEVSFGDKVNIRNTTDVALDTEAPAFMIGSATGINLGMDNNEIMVRNNGEASPLYLQMEGGDVVINSGIEGQVSRFTNGNLGLGIHNPTERLDVSGNARVRSLSGSGERIVYADANGILKTGSASDFPAVQIGSTNAMQCNAENRGKMNFIPNDEGSDVFGICLRNKDGNYYWGYMVGGNNPTNGSGAFGSGL